ncbi:hypothetical protein [Pseudonocardia sp. KRD291]|uniref:hypothetical protein n=1 Tax=Pseudonocardia sp. KRD291 TaxID=2792007 RepID=UPI001C4A616E|nr:hypothetical protein [Pseudonocardia sp. KRD291]MBW0105266.1 hypothetical protein [Pseudonocardia sp. KRD291]
MTSEYLRWVPADPGRGHLYYQDLLFQLALVGEAGHSIPPTNPTVAGQSLDYHWFTHAITAHAAAASGVDPALATLRFAPTALVLAAAIVAATVARSVTGRAWAAPLATSLLLVVGESGGTAWRATVPVLPMVHLNWWASLTQTFGDLVVVGLVGLVVAQLRPSSTSSTPVALLLPVAVLASGVKSTILPVVVCGVLLAAFAAVLQQRWRSALRAVTTAAGLGVVLAVATAVLYGGGSYGTVVAPLAGARAFAAELVPGLSARIPGAPLATSTALPLAATLALTGFWLAVSLTRWVGLLGLVVYRRREPATWLFVGVCLSGVIATLLLRHPGASEAYFLRTVFPVGAVGSAAGLALMFGRDRWQPAPQARTALIAFAAAAAFVAMITPWLAGEISPLAEWNANLGHPPLRAELGQKWQVWSWVSPVALVWSAVATVAAAVGVTAAVRTGRRGAGSAVAIAVLVGGLLGTGLQSTWGWTTGTSEPTLAAELAGTPPSSRAAVTADQVTAARWIRDNSAPEAVVATNRWCQDDYRDSDGKVRACAATGFWVPAFTQRRTMVAGWAYTAQTLDSGSRSTVAYTRQPFWDQPLLDLEEKAFRAPDRPTIAALRDRGVTFLLADRRAGRVDDAVLDSLATRVTSTDDATVWALR